MYISSKTSTILQVKADYGIFTGKIKYEKWKILNFTIR